MSDYKSLSLTHRFESPHPPLPDSGSLVGLLCPIIGILAPNLMHHSLMVL